MESRNAVLKFIANHQDQISGVLSGFDRLVFRGTLRSIAYAAGMNQYLCSNEILLKNFGSHVEHVSQRLKAASLAQAVATGRPVRYLASSALSKEDIARGIAAKDGITDGLVCVLTCVEPCRTFEIYRNRDTKQLQLQPRLRKCLFLYHYTVHPVFGFLNARIQTWFPFSIQIFLNGREWLAQQMDTVGLAYLRHDNCFPWIEDWPMAQQLLDQQLKVDWPMLLTGIAQMLKPTHDQIFRAHPTTYYWSTYQSEWAIDIIFRKAAELRRLYPRLLQHAMTTFGSTDVMRFSVDVCRSAVRSPSASLVKSSAISTSVRKGCASNTASTTTPSSYTTRRSPLWATSCAPKGPSTTLTTFACIGPRKVAFVVTWPGAPYG